MHAPIRLSLSLFSSTPSFPLPSCTYRGISSSSSVGFFPFSLLLVLAVVVVEGENEDEALAAFCSLRTAARRSEVLAFAFKPSDLASACGWHISRVRYKRYKDMKRRGVSCVEMACDSGSRLRNITQYPLVRFIAITAFLSGFTNSTPRLCPYVVPALYNLVVRTCKLLRSIASTSLPPLPLAATFVEAMGALTSVIFLACLGEASEGEEEAVFFTAGAALPLATILLFLATVAGAAIGLTPVFPLVPFLLVDATAAALETGTFFVEGLAVASLLFLAAAPVEAGASFRLLLRTAAPVFVTADLAAGMVNARSK